jgi:hypothetical protein
MSATILEKLVVQVKKQFDVVGSYELSTPASAMTFSQWVEK